MKSVLLDLVECFYLTNKVDGELEFSEDSLPITDKKISGQLLEYYQHLSFEEDCYFGDQFLGLVLYSIQSNGRKLESWGLEDDLEWQKGNYIIFAQNTSDDIIFCDVSNEKCPVYGMISGGRKHYKLGDSLCDFLSFCTKLIRLEMTVYHGDIYSDNNFNVKKEFIDNVSSIVSKSFSDETRDGLIQFVLN